MRVNLKKISQEEIDRHSKSSSVEVEDSSILVSKYEENKDAGQGRWDTRTGRTMQTPQEKSPGGASTCGRSSRILPPPSKTPSKLKRKSSVKRKSSPSTPRKSIFDLDDTMLSPQPAGKMSRSLSSRHSSDNYELAEENTPLDTEESSKLRRCYVEMRVSSKVSRLMKAKVDEFKRQKKLSTSPDDHLAKKRRKITKKKIRKQEVKRGPSMDPESPVVSFSSPLVSGLTGDIVVQSPMMEDSSVVLFTHPINENLSDNDCMIEGIEDENESEKDLENYDEMPYIDHDNKKRKMEERKKNTGLNFAKQAKSISEETQKDLNDNTHGGVKNVHVNARVERGSEGNSKVLNDKFFDNLYDNQNDPISHPHKATEHEFIHPPPRSPSQDPPNFVIHNASTEECSDLSLSIPPKLNLEILKKKGSKDSADILLNSPDVSNHPNGFIIPPKVSKAKAKEFKIPKMRGTKEELREQRSVPRSVQQKHKDEVRKMMKRVMDLDSWVNDRRIEAATSNQKKSHKLDDDDDKADLDDEGWRSFKTLQTDKERLEYFREQFGNQVSSDPTVNLSHQGWKLKCKNNSAGDYETAATERRNDFLRKVRSNQNHPCGKKCVEGCVDFDKWSFNVKEKAVDLFVESGGIYTKPTDDSVKKFALYAQGHISDGHRENQDFWGFYSEFQVSCM